MYLDIQRRVRQKFVQAVERAFGQHVSEPVLGFPPSAEMGDLSITSCFELAKQFRQAPRKIAEQVAPLLLPIAGVERVSIAGAGYLNLHLDRAAVASWLFALRASGLPDLGEPAAGAAAHPKILVEHTSINPNKAAHIGHLRNAVLGDTFFRLLRFRNRRVEIQNYIDNTGVQVADVVVGLASLEKKTLDGVRQLIADPAVRFDYYCWDLYARTFQWYEQDQQGLALRAEALRAIEEGHGELAAMAELVSTAIVRLHLETMLRLGVEYDLLVQESEILKLDFWKSAFELMKKAGAIRYEESGKNRGCWVMSLSEAGASEVSGNALADPEIAEDTKVIVRSNGTVTYVGKDIAYHLWKFGLLGKDFGYELFYEYTDGHRVWRTAVPGSKLDDASASAEPSRPQFGRASAAYAVIDIRQSYVQNVVRAAFHALGYQRQAANLHHFAYEVVGLSRRCAEEMGLVLSEEDRQKGYVEVSGRKGLGIKADDLMQALVGRALEEVRAREMTTDPAEQEACGRMIAVGALRYFLLKFTRRSLIAFDFKEALAFEGETGPYLQYSVVRARNIVRKFEEAQVKTAADGSAGLSPAGGEPGTAGAKLPASAAKLRPRAASDAGQAQSVASWLAGLSADQLRSFFASGDGNVFWELTLLAAQLEMIADQAIAAEEPAVLAKYVFRLAQAFNNFYHHHHILNEPDPGRQQCLLYLVYLVSETLSKALEQLGIEIPEKM
jgi:arginyl-tRNA synthetase